MQTRHDGLGSANTDVEPSSEHTHTQAIVQRRRVPVQALEYHLFNPAAHDPLLEDAYEVWRDGWRDTLLELEGKAELHSDEFARQDEIAVIAHAGRCTAVTGIRWLDLSLSRSHEDSYFKPWPRPAQALLGDRIVCIASNTVVHPHWRGTLIEPTADSSMEPTRLAFATVSLSVRRFVASSADCLIALTRNDRAMDRFATTLGATRLGQIRVHGIATDIVCIEHQDARCEGPVVNDLWHRRYKARPRQ